jgi:hypothetical protein
MMSKYLKISVLAVICLFYTFNKAVAHDKGVFFIEPKNNVTVTSPVHFKFGVNGMKIGSAGEVIEGVGHFHLLIDSDDIASGEAIPFDETHLHYGKGQTEATVPFKAGTHKVTLLLGNGVHLSYGKEWSQTITIHVK